MQFANTETNEVEQLSINKFFSWNFKENLKLCVTTLYIHTNVEKIHLKGMKRKLVENFFSKRILSVPKICPMLFNLIICLFVVLSITFSGVLLYLYMPYLKKVKMIQFAMEAISFPCIKKKWDPPFWSHFICTTPS